MQVSRLRIANARCDARNDADLRGVQRKLFGGVGEAETRGILRLPVPLRKSEASGSLRMTPSIGESEKVIGGVGEENYSNQSKDNYRGPSTTPLRGFAQDDTITGLEAGEELPVQLLLPKRCESR